MNFKFKSPVIASAMTILLSSCVVPIDDSNTAPTLSYSQTNNTLIANSTDVDGDNVSVTWSVNGEIISSGTQLDLTGEYYVGGSLITGPTNVLLTSSDGELNTKITIANVMFVLDNQAPVTKFTQTTDLISATSTDINNDTLVYTWSINGQTIHTGQSLDLTNEYLINGVVISGTQTIVLTTSDGELESSQNITNVILREINDSPIASYEYQGDSLVSTSTDSNNDELEISWSLDGTQISTQNSLDLTSTVDENGQLVEGAQDLLLSVTDGEYTDQITIISVPFNTSPIADIDSSNIKEVGQILTFDGSASSDPDLNDSIDTFSWLVDGQTIINENNYLDYTFNVAGDHIVTLIVTDNHGASNEVNYSFTLSALQNTAPTAMISSDISSGVAPTTITFDGSNSSDVEDGTNVSFNWYLGDVLLSQETSNEFVYEFTQSADYEVSLVVVDQEGLESLPVTQSVSISQPANSRPSANFTFDDSNLEAPVTITFDGSSSSDNEDGNNITFQWRINNSILADETSSTLNYEFLSSGDYSIDLVVFDTQDLSSDSTQVDITITDPAQNAKPTAMLQASATSELTFEDVVFTSTGSSDPEDGTNITYQWFVDDVEITSEVTSSFTFNSDVAGDFEIGLIVTDTQALTSDGISQIITISEPANLEPIADFTLSDITAVAPATITFDATDSYDPEGSSLTYQWEINDIAIAENTSVVDYEFTTIGDYDVKLIVTDIEGLFTQTTLNIVISDTPQNSIPVATINADALSGETPITITFDGSNSSDMEDGTNITYVWSLGGVELTDETSSTLSYEFDSEGTYEIGLVVTDSQGAASIEAVQSVTVTDPVVDTMPVAMFSAQAVDLLVSVDASLSTGDSITFAWDYNGEGTGTGNTSFYNFTSAGDKLITLVVSDINGDSDTYFQTITVTEPIVNDSIIFEEDFEDYADNAQPDGWDIYANYQKNPTYSPNIYNTSINVVSNDSNSGSKSLKIEGDGNNPMQIVKPLEGTYDKIYTRVYVKQTLQMGGLSGTNHDHIIALRADSGSANKEVRFGEAKGAIGTTLVNNSPNYDDGAPDPQSPNFGEHVVTADVWHCIEVGFDDTGDVSKLFAWSDGVLVHSIEQNSDFTNIKDTVEDHWMSQMFNELVFGWHSFSGHSNTLHFDDLVIATSRIGCDDSLERVILTPEFELTQDSMEVSADASASTGSSEFTYSWDFDGEYSTTGTIANYTFASGGNKDITLTLTSGSTIKSLTQTINVIDTNYIDLLERVSTNIVAPTCFACHETSLAKPLMFDSSMPADVESALSEYISNYSAQSLIDVPNGIGHSAMPADQITDTTNEQDWSELVLLIEANANRGGAPDHAFIFDDFEDQAHNSAPIGWSTAVEYQVDAQVNNSGNSSFVLIDSTMAYSGTNSVRVKTSNSVIKPTFLFQELPENTDAFYSRAWMYIPVQLGGGTQGPDGNHVHFMAYSGGMDGSNPPELRFGAAQDAILSAFLPTGIDAGTTNIKPTTVIPANQWVCVEFAIIKNETFDQTIAWVNGEETFAAITPTDWATNPGQYFSNQTQIARLISFGWRAFGDTKDVEDVWFDDIAVSEQYIGCN